MKREITALLSISLLVSSDKPEVKKCLNSLKPLMNAVDSELIVVHTSGREAVKNLIRNYTDKIVDFTWCNDFSKARNAGLERCNGEWFLYLDDDEWFEDTTELELFFNSGEYKKYGLANYIVRNFLDNSQKRYNDFSVTRAYRMYDGLRFKSPIHEYCVPNGPGKLLSNTIANHTGYIFASIETAMEKAKRNAPLLEAAIREDPDNPRWYSQQSHELFVVKDYTHSESAVKEGLKRISGKYSIENDRYRGSFYVAILENMIKSHRYKDAKDFIIKQQQDADYKHIIPIAETIINGELSIICYHIGKYKESLKYSEQFFESYEKICKNDDLRFSGTVFLDLLEDGDFILKINTYAASTSLKSGDISSFKLIFERVTSNEKAEVYSFIFRDNINLVEDLHNYIIKSEQTDDDAVYILNKLSQQSEIYEILIDLLSKKKSAPGVEKLISVYSALDKSHPYIVFLRLLNVDSSEDAIKLTSSISLKDWKRCVYYLLEEEGIPETVLDSIRNLAGSDYANYFRLKESESMLRRIVRDGPEKPDRQDSKLGANIGYSALKEAMGSYTNQCIDFYKAFYNDRCFKDPYPLLPEECASSIMVNKAIECLDLKRIAEGSSLLKEAMELYPPFTSIIQKLTNLYAAEHKSTNDYEVQDTQAISSEMLALSKALKSKIRELISLGKAEEALSTAIQLQSLTPNDKELDDIIAQISLSSFNT